MKNVLAGDCHEVVITCDVAWSAHHGERGSVTPDGQSHHSLSDAGHILSMMTGQSSAQESVRDERVEGMENTSNTRHKTLITQL